LKNIREVRASVLEIIVLAIALAFGINMLSSGLYDLMGETLGLVLGAVLVAVTLAFAAYRRLSPEPVSTSTEAAFITTRGARRGAAAAAEGKEFAGKLEFVSIPEYEFGEQLPRRFAALFAENPAFEQQWIAEPIDASHGTDSFDLNRSRGGIQLIKEMAEYLVVEGLAMHLSMYFNDTSFDKDLLTTFSREDVPNVLLRNRVLELFSRDFKDRPGFEESSRSNERDGDRIVSIHAPDRYFHRFELILPKGSKIDRSEDGALTIQNQSVSLTIRVNFLTYGVYLDEDFIQRYVGLPEDLRETAWSVVVDVDASVRRGFVAYGKNLAYHQWLDSYLDYISKQLGFAQFQEAIKWPVVRAAMRSYGNGTTIRPSVDSYGGDLGLPRGT
jgi:hypothetical protein